MHVVCGAAPDCCFQLCAIIVIGVLADNGKYLGVSVFNSSSSPLNYGIGIGVCAAPRFICCDRWRGNIDAASQPCDRQSDWREQEFLIYFRI